MSQQTYIIFYAASKIKNLVDICQDLLVMTGANEALGASRQKCTPTEWQRYNFALKGIHQDVAPADDVDDLRLTNILAWYKPGYQLWISITEGQLGSKFCKDFGAIDPEIAGECDFHSIEVVCGRQDIVDELQEPSGRLITTTDLSIRFWGYSTPPDPEMTWKLIQATSSFKEVYQQLEKCIGSIGVAMIMSV